MKHIKFIILSITLLSTCAFQIQAGKLHELAYAGNIDEITKLLKLPFPVNIDEKDKEGRTALLLACQSYNTKIAQFLIAHGANLNLQESKYGWAALNWACYHNNPELIRFLITHKANLELKDKTGYTVLAAACFGNQTEVAKLLIEGGANPDFQGDGWTALDWAYLHNNLELIRFLITHKANLELKTYDGNTLLFTACEENKTEIAKLLIEGGANVDYKNIVGRTAFNYAYDNNNLEIIKLLIAHKAIFDPEIKDNYTALLHKACKDIKPDIVKLLIKNGVNLDPIKEAFLDRIRSNWTSEQIATIFEPIIPFKAIKKDSPHYKFLQSVFVALATEFKKGAAFPIHLENSSLSSSKEVENPTAIIKTIEYFLGLFLGSKQPDYIMPKNMLSDEETSICKTLYSTAPYPLALKRLYNLNPYQLSTLCNRLKFAQAAYAQYFNSVNKPANISSQQKQLSPYKRFHDINIWFDKKLYNSFLLKSSTASLNLFLKKGKKILSNPDVKLKNAFFKTLLSTIGEIAQTGTDRFLRLQDFAQKISSIDKK